MDMKSHLNELIFFFISTIKNSKILIQEIILITKQGKNNVTKDGHTFNCLVYASEKE